MSSPSVNQNAGQIFTSPGTLVCAAVIEETALSKTFILKDRNGRSFDFKAGQFATIKLSINGKTCLRSYSISSPASRPDTLHLTVKRVPDGLVSNWLNDTVVAGSEIEIMNIGGDFNFPDLPGDKPFFLSGGSGITPVMSMMRTLLDQASDLDMTFVHFARNPSDLIFADELAFIRKRYPQATIHLVVDDLEGSTDFDGREGRLSPELLEELVPDHAERTIYMCGPEGFMKIAREITSQVPVKALHQESFGEAVVIPMPGSDEGGSVEFLQSGKSIECNNNETVLEAALDAGLWVESSCQQGICGSCKVKLASGEVDMPDLGGLQEFERAEGYILACCSRPKGAIRIDL
ncbi:hybrid-cluster NAD(P)-dependent oxidoreductase [Kiloniella sp. b19]|uniref:hybrid-cluster NAD(P)-dependent oxidoreductase n=1 Tax=Kiloniella sp. GXU_MW_B19 TaxID=3141326 RepID=UPI0031DC54AE